MKNTTMDSFNHQVSVKYLYKKNLTELGENYNDATKRIPTYNFLMSATSTSTMVRMTTDSSMRTNTGLTNPAEPGDRILHPSPPGTPSFHPSSVPLSSRALPRGNINNLRWWRLPIEERACRKTDLGGGDYYLRNSGLPPSYHSRYDLLLSQLEY